MDHGLVGLLEEVPAYGVLAASVTGLVGVLVFCYALGCCKGNSSKEGKEEGGAGEKSASESEDEPEKASKQQPKNKGGKSKQFASSKSKVSLPPHPLLAAEFKGHTGAVVAMDFDVNGKYLATCSEDRTIRLWYMKTLLEKEHKYARKNTDLDSATHIKFSPDGTAVVVSLAMANTIQVYRIMKPQKSGGAVSLADTGVEFPKLSSSSSVLSLDMASTGKFIMTYTEDSFTIWTLKGAELTSVPTLQRPNTQAAVSPCGKFVACAGFTPDVKLWEVEFSKNGEFQKVSKAMDLKGHSASVVSLSFSGDSHRMATVSKDNSWKFWDINVEYRLREDPKLLVTGQVQSVPDSLVSLSRDARVVAVSASFSISFFSTTSGELLQSLDQVHKGVITSLCWDPSSLYLVSAGGEDRHVRVWHNTAGMRETLKELEEKLPRASSEPLKRRMKEQIKETRGRLNSIENQ